ncbi:MAG TPA: excinuclease ABC subunit C [Rikenellaceae bacterium]|nr:excinuclease ABC subunit C [Rikenellaceae bacterium]
MTEYPHKVSLKERVKMLPSLPGVYRFINKEGSIIYIGKAKSLRNRVSQYLQAEDTLSAKTRVMVSRIASIEHTVVDSEADALLLENNLIKEFQPKYNIMLKDGKTYPWICVKNEPFPRVYITRRVIKDKSLYFGPYSSASMAYNLIELITSLFYLRDCKLILSDEAIAQQKYRPCLKYHIGKCKAPCVGRFSHAEYNNQIEKIVKLLKGDIGQIISEFREQMKEHAAALRFEEAQLFKEKIELITGNNNKSLVVSQTITNIDVFSLLYDTGISFGNYIRVVNGSIIQSLNLELKLPIEESKESVLSLFITEMHSKFGDASKEIIVPFYPDSETLAAKCHVPVKGDKFKLLKLSETNANQLKTEKIKQEENLRPDEHKARVMNTLMRDLGMKEEPRHIECFDNSNIQGKFAVSACVVFRDGVPSKKEYRHFNIKKVVGANDFATMKEVVNRRYSRTLAEGGELPQLIVIDGGKGQLSFAWEALRELGLENQIKIIGIAKRLEELLVPGDPHPLFLDKNSISLKVIMHLRDEAHRFGISHHRDKRSKSQLESELSSIPGIGTKSEEKLLRKFRSLGAIKRATFEELKEVAGGAAAKAITLYFSKA